MEIEQFNRSTKGFFKATDNGREAGRMTYSWAGDDKIIIDHTEVNPEFKGMGVGQKMVLEAVRYARENSVKILPLCPFAKSVFNKDKEIQDVLF